MPLFITWKYMNGHLLLRLNMKCLGFPIFYSLSVGGYHRNNIKMLSFRQQQSVLHKKISLAKHQANANRSLASLPFTWADWDFTYALPVAFWSMCQSPCQRNKIHLTHNDACFWPIYNSHGSSKLSYKSLLSGRRLADIGQTSGPDIQYHGVPIKGRDGIL